jgi:hypothetical protein
LKNDAIEVLFAPVAVTDPKPERNCGDLLAAPWVAAVGLCDENGSPPGLPVAKKKPARVRATTRCGWKSLAGGNWQPAPAPASNPRLRVRVWPTRDYPYEGKGDPGIVGSEGLNLVIESEVGV